MHTCGWSAVKLEVGSPEWSAWRSQVLVKESTEAAHTHMTNEVQEAKDKHFKPVADTQKHESGTCASPAALRYMTLQKVIYVIYYVY